MHNLVELEIPDQRQAVEVAALFSTLADPTRVRIIAALLSGEINVGALAGLVGVSESAVSHQLRHLRHTRLVQANKRGREVYYCLDDDHVAELFQRGLEHVSHD
ncbi:MAG: metalloregulator ArsR/SmtB family transcription factor [Anaerolineales bacterium]|nr:metalloregulator ArsR/SmtB family transcription factor [Anaerolineales bacterium]